MIAWLRAGERSAERFARIRRLSRSRMRWLTCCAVVIMAFLWRYSSAVVVPPVPIVISPGGDLHPVGLGLFLR